MGKLRDVIEHVLKKRPRRGKEKIVVLRKVKRKSFALSIAYPGKLSYFTRKKLRRLGHITINLDFRL